MLKRLVMTSLFLLGVLLSAVFASSQTYEPDGAIRSMSQTHVWNSGSSAWDKWEGVVTGPLTDVQLRATPVPVSGTFWPTTAGAPASQRLSDGAAFYDAAKTGQLPAALVGSRLDVNLGSWLGSTAPSVGQKTMANSLPVTIASDQAAIPVTPAANSSVNVAQIAGNTTSTVASGVQKVGVADSAGNAIPSATSGPALTDRGLEVRTIDSERTTSGTIDGAVLNSAVTISGEGASSITVNISTGLSGAGSLAFEGTVDGSTWMGVPVNQYFGASTTTLPNHFNEADIFSFTGLTATTYKFTQPGFRSYRVRVSTAGAAGTATVVLSASAATTEPVENALYFAGAQSFDLTLPGNTVIVNTKGAAMFGLTWSATLGASTVTPTAAGAALECYSLAHASDNSRNSWTGAVQGISWVCPLYGAASVSLTKDIGIGAGSSTVTFWVSMSSSVPNETRPVSQWVAGASPTSTLVGATKPLINPEGRQAITLDHPRWFQCAMTSTATTSTVITTCSGAVATLAAPGAGLRFYITAFDYSSSIISTTANFMTLRYGTGGTCGTGTTSLWVGSNVAAFSPREPDFGPNGKKAAQNNEVCFIHPGAGTRWINVSGYVAP